MRKVHFTIYLYDLGYLPEMLYLVSILRIQFIQFLPHYTGEPVTLEIKRLLPFLLPWKLQIS